MWGVRWGWDGVWVLGGVELEVWVGMRVGMGWGRGWGGFGCGWWLGCGREVVVGVGVVVEV